MPASRAFVRTLVFAGLAMFVADCSFGQVVIRERVEVDPGAPAETSAPGPTSDAGFVASGFVTPVSGQLLLYYERAERIFTAIPENVYLTVLRNGDEIFAVDTFLTRLPDHLVSTQFIFDGCTGGFEYYDFHIYTNGSGEGALFEVGAVSAGDTLAFGYTSDNGTFGGDVVPLDPNDPENTIWLAQLGLYYSCIQQYIDFVRFSVAVVGEAPAELAVTASPDTLALGASAILGVEGRDAGGEPVALPVGATLDLTLDQGGGTVGFLRWNEVEGVVLAGVPAADIEAGLVEIVASEPQVPALTLPSETSAVRAQEEKNLSEESDPPTNSMDGETILTVTAALSDDPSVTGSATVTVLPTVVLTDVTGGAQWQDRYFQLGMPLQSPKMPNIQLQAQLLPADPGSAVEFHWTYEISHDIQRVASPCARHGEATFRFKQTVTGDAEALWTIPFTADPSSSPSLDSVTFLYSGAKPADGDPAGHDFLDCEDESTSWQEVNGWAGRFAEMPLPNDDPSLQSDLMGTGHTTALATDDVARSVMIGGDVTVSVTAFIDGQQIGEPAVSEPHRILGSNLGDPAQAQPVVRAFLDQYLSDNPIGLDWSKATLSTRELLAMVEKESTYWQFNPIQQSGNPSGYPLYTNSNGMGLGQLDFHPATELQLWNWQRNIIGASTQFWKDKRFILEREDREVAGAAAARQRIKDAYPDGAVRMCPREDQDVTAEEFVLKGAYARYNGGTGRWGNYWDYQLHGNCWQKGVNPGNAGRNVDSFWIKFLNITP